MPRGLKAPLNGSEKNALIGLVGQGPSAREIPPAIRKRLKTLDLIAEAHNSVVLTPMGQTRAASELKTARGERGP